VLAHCVAETLMLVIGVATDVIPIALRLVHEMITGPA
jgi:hypothetical protein